MSIFSKVKPVKTPRTIYNLAYTVKTSMSLGKLYPIMCDEVVPGDSFKIRSNVVIRFQPLLAPVLHEINAYIHYFFVPYRILSDENFDWTKFITGFEETNVDSNGDLQEYDVPLPRWIPTKNGSKTLWDYLGFPVNVDPEGAYPLDFPRRAYNMIWNEYYRDENLMEKVSLDNEDILRRCWSKDYFTSALPFQQRGTSPALPISGTAFVELLEDFMSNILTGHQNSIVSVFKDNLGGDGDSPLYSAVSDTELANVNKNLKDYFAKNAAVKIDNLATADINDFRLAFQIQKWLERNARCGVRYTEFLRAHYGVAPRDERLQRPEYIGGSKSPIIVSEVVQQSSTDSTSPQGNLAGRALTATSEYAGRYFATEFGLVMGIMSVMPKVNYCSQGINRQWLRRTKYDFFSPEFQNLSEQAIENAEIFAQSPAAGETTQPDNTKIFGFQGRYDEMRTKQDIVTGEMRDLYDYWHLARKFEELPKLGKTFLECNPSNRIFAVQNDYDTMQVCVGNVIRAIRPLGYPEPGLIDHH